MTARLLPAIAALMLLCGCKVPPVVEPVATVNYPRAATYAWLRDNGEPLAHAGVIDTAAVLDLARYDVVSIDPYRYGINAEALELLRSELRSRRGTTLLAFVPTYKFFVCGPGWYGGDPVYGCDTTALAFSRFRCVQHFDGLLYRKDGSAWGGGGYIDFSRRGMPEALADTVADWAPAGQWDGIFSDETALSPYWATEDLDYRRAGFFTLSDWSTAYTAGMTRYFARLRERLGSRLVIGNGGPDGSPICNGWMVENFPYQNGGSPAAYLAREATYAPPQLNWLSAWATSGDPASPENLRKARYALGVATLGSGVGVITWSPQDAARGTFLWLPELEPRGWLGRPLGPPYPAGWAWRRDFEGGSVFVDEVSGDATFTRGGR